MIVDVQHHYSPRELFKDAETSGRQVVHYDAKGAPTFNAHAMLYDLDQHVAMMDMAGIDVAVLTSPHGMRAELEQARFINDRNREAEKAYPGRFRALGHANPLAGAEGIREVARCADTLGFPGVVVQSEIRGKCLDDPTFEPFWAECEKRGLYVFVHPALAVPDVPMYDADDLGRAVGREFSLVAAVIRLINGGVLDRYPDLLIHVAHLGGGIASLLGRIRGFQDKTFWATRESARHGRLPEHDIDWYLANRMLFDTAGFCGDLRSVRNALTELPPDRILFGSDYPQEIRAAEKVRDFVRDIRTLGAEGEAILAGNVPKLLSAERLAA